MMGSLGQSRGRAVLGSLFGVLAFLAAPAVARADDGWVIKKYDVRLVIEHDGTVDITETIDARFDEPKHGIFREIPVRYDVNGHLYDLRLHLLSVTDGAGERRNRSVTEAGNLIRIRIGDADRTLTGPQTYVLHYRVARAVIWEGEHSVLRWNATGTEWRVPILEGARVVVTLPQELDDSKVQYDGWTGRFGAKQQDFTKKRIDGRTVEFNSQPLGPGEGITVEIAMPGDAVERASLGTRLAWWLADNFIYGLIPAWLVGGFALWYLRGRDLAGKGTVVVNYEPPEGLGPAEVGTLTDESVDMKDISSILIDLAVRGYLTIEEVKKPGLLGSSTEYIFHKRKDGSTLKPHEHVVFKKVFGSGDEVELSDLQNKFFDALPQVKDQIYQSLTREGYFIGRPDRVRTTYTVLGVLVAALTVMAAAVAQNVLIGRVFSIPLVITAIALIPIVLRTAQVMPRRSAKGREAWEKVRGLEEFISRAEVDDLKTQERQSVFEKLLPYATVFGLTKRWAKAFEGLYTQPPDWYRPAHDGPFNMYLFGSSIDNSVGRMNSTFPTQPRAESSGSSGWSSGGFGGGGSSGGGFGGGGGGSW